MKNIVYIFIMVFSFNFGYDAYVDTPEIVNFTEGAIFWLGEAD